MDAIRSATAAKRPKELHVGARPGYSVGKIALERPYLGNRNGFVHRPDRLPHRDHYPCGIAGGLDHQRHSRPGYLEVVVRPALVVQVQCASYDARVSAEPTIPQSMAQDDDMAVTSGLVFLGREGAAHKRTHPEDGKKRSGCRDAGESFRFPITLQCELRERNGKRCQIGEGAVLLSEVNEVGLGG